MAQGKLSETPDMQEIRVRFQQWRQTRQAKTSIPEELWSAGVELARREGVGRTAAALHLDGGKLKRLMLASNSNAGKAMAPAFVESIAAGGNAKPEYTNRVERPQRHDAHPLFGSRADGGALQSLFQTRSPPPSADLQRDRQR